ncbi:MAG: cyclic pyranopterin monophosphate synthase MoaC [Sandaracinaceae bacterium]|nr:cyclic pyranopterin monophosphate synthase MoaC [Sandaracinaceae bacterium]
MARDGTKGGASDGTGDGRSDDRDTAPDLSAALADDDPTAESKPLTHLSARGEAHMVDVGDKDVTQREARARGALRMAPETRRRLLADDTPKGDVFASARIAGIQAAKRTADLIPLCHPLSLNAVSVTIDPDPDDVERVWVEATVRCTGKTGVEMEALTAASVALLTLYDMLKGIDREMVIESVALHEKRGGRRGHYVRG